MPLSFLRACMPLAPAAAASLDPPTPASPRIAALQARSLAIKLTQPRGQLAVWPQARHEEMVAALAAQPLGRQRAICAAIVALAHVGLLDGFDARVLVEMVAPWDVDRRTAVCAALRQLRCLWRDTTFGWGRFADCLQTASQLVVLLPPEGLEAHVCQVVGVARRLRLAAADLPGYFGDVTLVPAAQRADVLEATAALRRPGRIWLGCDDILLGLVGLSSASRAQLVEGVNLACRAAVAPAQGADLQAGMLRDTTCATLLRHPPARWPAVVAHLGALHRAMAGHHVDGLCFAIALRRQWPLPAIVPIWRPVRRWPA